MPRYFFDVHDGFHIVDDVGRDLSGLEAAKTEALRIAGGFASNERMLAEDGGALVVVIRDSPDEVALQVRLAFSIEQPWKRRQRVPVKSSE